MNMFVKKTLLLAVSLVFSFGLTAQDVNIEAAQSVASNFISMKKGNINQANLIVSHQHTVHGKLGEPLLYIFNFEGGGFVIVSADKSVEPILAYSTTNNFLFNGANAAARDIVNGYANGISYNIKEKVTPTLELKNEWAQMEAGVFSMKQQKSGVGVGPLLTSVWNQDMYYNEHCLDVSNGLTGYDNRTPNGCVALAMAQIMYYHRNPRNGQGHHEYSTRTLKRRLSANFSQGNYNYEAMSDKATGYSHALAQLIFHLGVSVEMDYDADGSGAFSEDVVNAIKRFFPYYKTSLSMKSKVDFTDSEWIGLVKADLDKGLPVYYAARRNMPPPDRDAGHAWVCDGYDDQNRLHHNFGWGGSGNGFYTLATIGNVGNPAYAYIHDNRIITGIEPVTDMIKSTGEDTLTAIYGSFSDGSSPRVNYANNTNRSWLVSPQEGRNVTRIMLNSAYFFTEDDDVVTIYGGNTADENAIVAVLSGKITDTTVIVNSSQAYITFIGSNATNTGNGFKFTYTSNRTSSNLCPASTPTPGGYLSNTSGTVNVFNTDGYDDANMCYWALKPNGAKCVGIVFTDFNLGEGDVVEVYKWNGSRTWMGMNYYTHGVHRFTKENPPVLDRRYDISEIVGGESVGAAYISFKTDNNIHKSGFSFDWEGAEVCGVSVHESSIGFAHISIYPNPATDNVRVQVETLQPETLQIVMSDIVGRTLYTTVLQGNDNQITQDIDISKFAKGVYLLQVITSKGQITKKVVVQ